MGVEKKESSSGLNGNGNGRRCLRGALEPTAFFPALRYGVGGVDLWGGGEGGGGMMEGKKGRKWMAYVINSIGRYNHT